MSADPNQSFVAAGVVMVAGFGLMAQRMLREPLVA